MVLSWTKSQIRINCNKNGNVKYSMVKRCRGGQGAATTVIQATACLSYLGMTPDRVAGISCCWHCLSQSGLVQNKHTHMCMNTHLLTHICFHIALLGLYKPGPHKTGGLQAPPRWPGTAAQPDNYHPVTSHSLPAEPVWLFFCMRHFLWGQYGEGDMWCTQAVMGKLYEQ